MANSKAWAVGLAVFGIGLGALAFRPAVAPAQAALAGASVKYTVVDTEGTNLLVVDNSSNTMYYYTVDPGKEVGSPLHLRGTIDLNEVGKPEITPKHGKKVGE